MRDASQREWIHQPAEDHGGYDESSEHHRGGPDLLARVVAHQHREHDRHEEGKERKQEEMAGHVRYFLYFLPMAMSKASRMTRKFKRPATMRKLLPYS